MQMIQRVTMLLALLMVCFLPGCSLFASEPITPPPPPASVFQPDPALDAGNSSEEPSEPPAGAAQGEIVFARDGQLWTVGVAGNERLLTSLPVGSVLRSLVLSPSGRYVAFTVASQQVMVLDVGEGQPTVIAETLSGSCDSLVWAADSDSLLYAEAEFDAEGLMVANRIWRVDVSSGTPPQVLHESDMAADPAIYFPGFTFGSDLLAVRRMIANSDDPGSWLLLTPSSGETAILADGYGLWDVSTDQTKVLLFRQSEAMSSDVSLYQGTIPQPPGAIIDIVRLSPETAPGVFWSARFAPDNVRVVALQVAQTEQGGVGQAVLLQPDASGIYQITALAPQPGADDMMITWHGEDGVVVQRWMPGEAGPSLWLLPLDGSPGQLLAVGEMPLVVVSR